MVIVNLIQEVLREYVITKFFDLANSRLVIPAKNFIESNLIWLRAFYLNNSLSSRKLAHLRNVLLTPFVNYSVSLQNLAALQNDTKI